MPGVLGGRQMTDRADVPSGVLAEAVLAAIRDGVLVVDDGGRIRSANRAAEELFGAMPAGLVGLDVSQLVPSDLRARHRQLVAGFDPATTGAHLMGRGRQLTARRLDGATFPVEVTLTQIKAPGTPLVCANIRDATERSHLESRLRHLSLHDPLTGLGNRLMLTDHLQQVLARRERHGGTIAVLMCDLDHFKPVNDSYGHPVGDQLLIEVAARLREVVRPEDTVVRFGGDEFVILCEQLPSAGAAYQLAQRVLAATGRPTMIEGHLVLPALSVGVATIPVPDVEAQTAASARTDAQALDTLIADADLALFAAKNAGRARVSVFHEHMRVQVLGRMQLLGDLPGALARGELEVFYQPMVDLGNRTIVGAEALVRWRHPSRGLLQPDVFLPFAADSDLMIDLDTYVINRACADLTSLSARTGRPLEIWANLSARTIAHPGLSDLTADALSASGCPPDNLILEVTETALMHDLTATSHALHRVRDHGVRLALDDFGTGHSALSYLTGLPIQAVKLDRLFATRLGNDPVSQAIVHAVTTLGRALNLITVAEGIETPEQLHAATTHGCHRGQGFFLGQPVDLTGFGDLTAPASPPD
jgi:diguanylate cyclase (GGDEF)-like protein/PAS domain S-box-containing protein